MRALVFLTLLAAFAPSASAASEVQINIEWRYKDFDGAVALYEVKGRPPLWHTDSVPDLAAAPVGQPIAPATLSLAPGQNKRFILVVQNKTDKPQHFFAAPHTAHPEESALGFKFKCLCINHAYLIKPHQTWYRVVEFRLSRQFTGEALTIAHTIIGIDPARAEAFKHEMSMPDM